MKIICDECALEILDDEFVSTDDAVYHADNCFLEYAYRELATFTSREEYINYIKRLEKELKNSSK